MNVKLIILAVIMCLMLANANGKRGGGGGGGRKPKPPRVTDAPEEQPEPTQPPTEEPEPTPPGPGEPVSGDADPDYDEERYLFPQDDKNSSAQSKIAGGSTCQSYSYNAKGWVVPAYWAYPAQVFKIYYYGSSWPTSYWSAYFWCANKCLRDEECIAASLYQGFCYLSKSPMYTLCLQNPVSYALYFYNFKCNDPPPADPLCGTGANPSVATQKIVGGWNSAPYAWPWQVRLSLYKSGGASLCSGSLVRVSNNHESTDIIVTAAHCVKDAFAIRVAAGEYSTTQNEEVVAWANTYYIHQSYIPIPGTYGGTHNDIAIIRTSTQINFVPNKIYPVCIPSSVVASNTQCYASGWGLTEFGSTSTILKEVILSVLSNAACPQSIISTNLCTSGVSPTSGSSAGICLGDSGGPLVCDNQAPDQYYLHGITSYVWYSSAAGQCTLNSNYPSVFVKVANYCSWLKQYINVFSTISDSTTNDLC